MPLTSAELEAIELARSALIKKHRRFVTLKADADAYLAGGPMSTALQEELRTFLSTRIPNWSTAMQQSITSDLASLRQQVSDFSL